MLEIVDPVVQRNAFFGHTENLLLAILTDDRSYIRELASGRQGTSTTTVRQFRVPTFNFAATDYVDLISWKETSRCLELVNLLLKGCCHTKKFWNLSRTRMRMKRNHYWISKVSLSYPSKLKMHQTCNWSVTVCVTVCVKWRSKRWIYTGHTRIKKLY